MTNFSRIIKVGRKINQLAHLRSSDIEFNKSNY